MNSPLISAIQLKLGSNFSTMANVFGMGCNLLHCIYKEFVTKCGQLILQNFLACNTMMTYCKVKATFNNFQDAIKVISVTFQQLYACGADYGSKQVYFLGKHKAIGFKTKVVVDPNDCACFNSPPYPSLVHDMKILCNQIEEHMERLEKGPEDDCKIDNICLPKTTTLSIHLSRTD